MKRVLKVFTAALCLVFAMGAFAACGDDDATDKFPDGTEVTVSGSTSLQPLMEVLAEAFEDLYDGGVSVTVGGGGSGTGRTEAKGDVVDFGMISDAFTEADEDSGLTQGLVAKDGIAVIVNRGNDIDNLTMAQIKGIYTKADGITSWADIDAEASGTIKTVVRESSSGTRTAFMEIIGLKGAEDPADSIVATGTPAVMASVSTNSNAIAYESLGYCDNSVKILKIDGVDATVANIQSGDYKISRELNVIYKAATVAEGSVQEAFLRFLMSAEAQEIISDEGYVSVYDDADEYVA